MPSDYDAITKKNLRELGEKTSSRKTQVCSYSDPTHFIYEILQNADDYEATEISFSLSKRELSIEHNGVPFKAENVKAITTFEESTSRKHLIKTGRFGVGFKSVFAFTATPKIFSGNEHFKIYGLYRLKDEPYPQGVESGKTKIVLPFNHEQQKPDFVFNYLYLSEDEAYDKIAHRLMHLNMHTLLFTLNLREIKWRTETSDGHYLREDKDKTDYRISTITNGCDLHSYLVFSRRVIWNEKKYKPVEIAFGLDENEQIRPIDDYLYVLFPTKQETHLRFILNGPYRTTPSRENVSVEDDFNQHLVNETSNLISDLLLKLRDTGYLKAAMLGVFPKPEDNVKPFYTPILNAVLETFKKEKIIPTESNTFESIERVYRAPAAIRKVVKREELAFFTGRDNVYWVKGVTKHSPSDKFFDSLEINQWDWGNLYLSLKNKFTLHSINENDMQWLQERPDHWMQQIYCLLGDGIRQNEFSFPRNIRRLCSIIRVTQGEEIYHVPGEDAYFPANESSGGFHKIVLSILEGNTANHTEKIRTSLETLGVSEIGEQDIIRSILTTKYATAEDKPSYREHLNHMRLFLSFWKKTNTTDTLNWESIFLDEAGHDFLSANKCYIDEPLHSTGLKHIYENNRDEVNSKHLLWSGYKDLIKDGFLDFTKDCGVDMALSVIPVGVEKHPNKMYLMEDCLKNGARRNSQTEVNQDFTIADLDSLLNMKDIAVNRLIWDAVRMEYPYKFEAKYKPNRKYEERFDKSSLIILLEKKAWIPDRKSTFHIPSNITEQELHPDFQYDDRNGWLQAIHFGANSKQATEKFQKQKEQANELDLPVEFFECWSKIPLQKRGELGQHFIKFIKKKESELTKEATKENPANFQQAFENNFMKSQSSRAETTSQAGGVSKNPDRRREKVGEEITDQIQDEKASQNKRSLALRRTQKIKNEKVRTELKEWYGGKCQICDETFVQRNGEPYFDAVYLAPRQNADWRDRVGNALCLCPWHGAMFLYGSVEFNDNFLQYILDLKTSRESEGGHTVLPLRLCGENVSLQFVDKHLIDLQELIKTEQAQETSNNQPTL